MTQLNPLLKLNRLVIFTNDGEVAYDESFHERVNIICGQNSSGKSTIANFIFFVLGGDFKKWTSAALRCTDVYAEILINNAPVTLKRTVSTNSNQPMYIFWGNYSNSALSPNSQDWQIFPYRRSEHKKSFSNTLFLSLGLPELRGEVDSNITMHQILRLLYIDQKSLTLDLLMTESFDSSITRKTIADLLFGVYDDSLYEDRINLRSSEKNYEIKKKQFAGIEQIFSLSDNEFDSSKIKFNIENNNKKITEIDNLIKEYELNKKEDQTFKAQIQLKTVSTQENLLKAKRELSLLQEEVYSLNIEIKDSEDFIETLEKRLLALANSLLTKQTFDNLQLSHCPNCLSIISSPSNNENCVLCKQKLPEDLELSQRKRMQQEIDNQIRESKKLLIKKNFFFLKTEASFSTQKEKVNQLQKELNEALERVTSTRNEDFEQTLIQKGELKSENTFLIKQLRALEQIEVLRKELSILRETIGTLKFDIQKKQSQQRKKLETAYKTIQKYTLEILQSDLERQPEFHTGEKIELNFEKNFFALDGENNFSESSNVFLKNSVRFAIFFTSLEKDFFRYPRFVLCDNIEDKGMEPQRSQSFQKKLIELSLLSEVEHQIIITTSMVAPELKNSSYCVGDFYTKEAKTLKL